MSKTIKLKNYSNIFEEYEAAAVITPGMLIQLTSAGKVQKHATSGGDALPMFALEDSLQGKTITDNYATGDQVQVWIPGRGDQVYAILADGQNVAIGDFLCSDGLGHVTKFTTEAWNSADAQQSNTVYSMPIVGVALEAQDLSALDGSNSSLAENSQYIAIRIV